MPVNTERKDFADMRVKWDRLRDCYDGRDAILHAGEKYVPALTAKDGAENEAYRRRGNFYNAVMRTVNGMTGAIFQEAPDVEVPPDIEPYLDDITLSGIPFEMFAQEAGREILLTARYGVLVDMPTSPDPNNRPYCMPYKAEAIVNWKTTRILGNQILTMVVLKEEVDVPKEKDPFSCDIMIQYRVVELINGQCQIQLWRESRTEKGVYEVFGPAVIPMRRGAPLTFVPFVFICAKNATPDLEQPPLIDLADVNLGHWRNSVDYEYGLHLVALPTPWVAGSKSPGDGSTPLKIGPSVVWELDVQGQAGMLEFSGSGLGAIMSAMEEKKKQMATLGARLLEDVASVQETASAVKMRHAGENASLKTVAQSIEVGFAQVLKIVTWWMQTSAEEPVAMAVSVELNKEYLNIKASAQDITAALAALQANEISFETWWNILLTGGWGREEISVEEEQKAIDDRKKKQDAAKPPPAPPTTKIVKDGQGNVKYQIQDGVPVPS